MRPSHCHSSWDRSQVADLEEEGIGADSSMAAVGIVADTAVVVDIARRHCYDSRLAAAADDSIHSRPSFQRVSRQSGQLTRRQV